MCYDVMCCTVLYCAVLTGPIPPEIGALTAVEEVFFYDNFFEQQLPTALSQCTSLLVLRLQHNLLTGSLDGVFAADMLLENVDLSDNRFSGEVATGIFSLPAVSTVALSLNCFEGSLPESMCAARNASVLSMDGLGAAKGCRHSVQIPLSGVMIFNTLEGPLPPCVWSLPVLQVLHLTGNGLTGSIGETGVIGPDLHTVSLGKCACEGSNIAFVGHALTLFSSCSI